jgi:type 1 glutamine amidotransferase
VEAGGRRLGFRMTKHLRTALVGALSIALAVPVLATAPAASAQQTAEYDVLVVGKTTGFRHSSIDEATTAIMALGEANGFTVDVWDPPTPAGAFGPSPGQPLRTLPSTPFTTQGLAKYETVVFVSTVDNTNDLDPARATLLDASELAAFQGYIRGGGGFAGIHAATDSMHTVPWYGQLTGGGARFRNHPAPQNAVLHVEDRTHPSTEMLPRAWSRFDEWYNFTANPRSSVHTLITLDESSYNPGSGAMGADHPISWCQNFEGGRSWYEGGGHTEASYTEPLFLQHVLGGIEWSAGVTGDASDCAAFHDAADVLDELVDDGLLREGVATRILDTVDRAQEQADRGNNARAIRLLDQAIRRAESLIGGRSYADRQLRAQVVAVLDDLVDWQFAAQNSRLPDRRGRV